MVCENPQIHVSAFLQQLQITNYML